MQIILAQVPTQAERQTFFVSVAPRHLLQTSFKTVHASNAALVPIPFSCAHATVPCFWEKEPRES